MLRTAPTSDRSIRGVVCGMPTPWDYEASDGVFVLYNGVTRATRIAKAAIVRLPGRQPGLLRSESYRCGSTGP